MEDHETIIRTYFNCWLEQDGTALDEIFAPDINYSECYGPEYRGLETIKRWFSEWNHCGKVLNWDIKQFIHQEQRCAVEWYFNCVYDGENGEFDGVSLIEFDEQNRIVSLKEFQSKIPHEYPYQ